MDANKNMNRNENDRQAGSAENGREKRATANRMQRGDLLREAIGNNDEAKKGPAAGTPAGEARAHAAATRTSPVRQAPVIVVIGGGYAGLQTLFALKKELRCASKRRTKRRETPRRTPAADIAGSGNGRRRLRLSKAGPPERGSLTKYASLHRNIL